MTARKKIRDEGVPVDISSPGKKTAVVPAIIREEAIDIAESMRKKKLFGVGTEEEIISAGLIWWPFIHVKVRYMGGIIRKQMKDTGFLLDGLTADGITIDNGYKRYPLFSGLTGLDSISIRILCILKREGSTEEEILTETGIAEKDMKKLLQKLTKNRILSSSILPDKTKIYIPLIRKGLPKINNLHTAAPALRLKHLEGISRSLSFSEDEIDRILKGIEPECGITGFQIYYYPVYEVLLDDMKGNVRPLLIDGRTGKEIIS